MGVGTTYYGNDKSAWDCLFALIRHHVKIVFVERPIWAVSSDVVSLLVKIYLTARFWRHFCFTIARVVVSMVFKVGVFLERQDSYDNRSRVHEGLPLIVLWLETFLKLFIERTSFSCIKKRTFEYFVGFIKCIRNPNPWNEKKVNIFYNRWNIIFFVYVCFDKGNYMTQAKVVSSRINVYSTVKLKIILTKLQI